MRVKKLSGIEVFPTEPTMATYDASLTVKSKEFRALS